ncbi:ABC transporter substrate-binding protein [Aureimonas endophytica]|uniref:ABC transporter substrate-binding protein n=1 Tax=Aureimonas endophytica TaxID=2027858 RepID=A0A917E3Z0_9HYPH|nr:transporter substrate-binding domain-containing protein [Aureimonas endophytica]GGE01364.1 ABC transporter substrate-binding protein [Aureimonas endophytica]
MKRNILAMTAGALAACCLGTAASAQDCKPAHAFETVEKGFLTVSTTTYAPFSYVDKDGSVGGVDGDIVEAIAKLECLKVKAVATDPSAAIQYILTGRSDLSTGDWYRTAERAKVVGLSGPLYTDQMGIYSKDGYKSVKEIEGKSVGTVQGYLWVADLQKVLGAKLKLYPNSSGLSKDLEAGRLEVGVDGYASGAYARTEGGFKGLKIEVSAPDERVRATVKAAQAGLPYTKGNAALGKALDADIATLHKDGTIASILKKHKLDASAAEVGEPRLVE